MSVKDLFTSRYPNGVLIQGDQSQLEVRVLAYLSQDHVLIQEIKDNTDIHTMNCRAWKGREDITDKERTSAKAMTFQLTYGAGANRMEQTLGIPVEEAKSFIREFYDKYHNIRKWHEDVAEEVKQSNSNGIGKYQGPSGRVWTFEEGAAPKFMQDRGIMRSFKPTDTKNYPVQGTAADVLIIQRGRLFRSALRHRDKFLIINTVHDSIMLDCKEEYVTMATSLLKEVMEDTSEINKVFREEFNVPLKCDISVGNSWATLEKYNE
jgi:DNA polymerase-1